MKGKKFTKEHRLKISKSNRGNQNCLGHNHTQKTIDLMTAKRKLNPSRRPKNPEVAHQRRSSSLKAWYATAEGEAWKKELGVLGRAKGKILRTACVICGAVIEYHPNGKRYKPKTCGSECTSELRRRHLNKRRELDPGMDRRAAMKRYSK